MEWANLVRTLDDVGNQNLVVDFEVLKSQADRLNTNANAGIVDSLVYALKKVEHACEIVRKEAQSDVAYPCVQALVEVCDEIESDNTKINMARANCYRLAGAIASDRYRDTSDITFHIQALTWELLTLRLFAKSWDGKSDSTDFVNAINSVSVSAYRLRNYSVALPLADLADRACRNDKIKVKGNIKGKVLRDRAATYFAYGFDLDTSTSAFGLGSRSAGVASQMAYAVSEKCAKEARNVQADRQWPAILTGAEALFYSEKQREALNLLASLRDEILEAASSAGGGVIDREIKGRASKFMLETLGRCCYQLARFELNAERPSEEAANNVDSAYAYAAESLAVRVWGCGLDHVDVRKSLQLLAEAKDAGGKGELHPDVEYEIEAAKGHLGSTLASLTEVELTNNIVRGDAISLEWLFGVDKERFEQLYKALTGEKPHKLKTSQMQDPTLPRISYTWEGVMSR